MLIDDVIERRQMTSMTRRRRRITDSGPTKLPWYFSAASWTVICDCLRSLVGIPV